MCRHQEVDIERLDWLDQSDAHARIATLVETRLAAASG